LLKEYSKEHILKTIAWYVNDCKKNKIYMKNFGTFLNNLPDMTESKQSYANDNEIKLKYFDIPNSDLFGYPEETLIQKCKDGEYQKIQA